MLVSLKKQSPTFFGVKLPTRKPPVVLENVSKVAPKSAPAKAAAPTQLSPAGVTDPSKSATPTPTAAADKAAAENRILNLYNSTLNRISSAASHAAQAFLGVLSPKTDADALNDALAKAAENASRLNPAAAVAAATSAAQQAMNTAHVVKTPEADPIDTVVASTAARIVVATPDAAAKLGAPATVSVVRLGVAATAPVVTSGVTVVSPSAATVNPAAFRTTAYAPPPVDADGAGAPVAQILAVSGYAQASAALVPTADPNSVRSAPL